MKTFNEFVTNKENLLLENFAHDAIFKKLKTAAITDFNKKDTLLGETEAAIHHITTDFRLTSIPEGKKVIGLLFEFKRKLTNLINTSAKTVQGGMHGIGSVTEDIGKLLGDSYLALQYALGKSGGEIYKPSMFGRLKNIVTGNSGANTNPWHKKDIQGSPR